MLGVELSQSSGKVHLPGRNYLRYIKLNQEEREEATERARRQAAAERHARAMSSEAVALLPDRSVVYPFIASSR